MKEGVIDGRFQIEEAIARTETSELYRAQDLQTGQLAAIKVLRPSSADTNELLTRRLQEYKVLRKLDHPNSVHVIHANLTPDNVFYVAMEYLTGRTLTQLVDEVGPLPPEIVAGYLDQIASVLDAAHGLGIIHRDIRTSNILVQLDENENEVIKVLGFLMAKVQGDPGKDLHVTKAGVAIGNPAFMSPEQAMGKKVTKHADIYALGVTLYAVLTGELPFEGKNDLQTMIAHVKSAVPRFSEKNRHNTVSKAVEDAVRWAMSKELADRPSSAGELARVFREAVEDPSHVPPVLQKVQERQEKLTASQAIHQVPRVKSATPQAAAPGQASNNAFLFTLLAVGVAIGVGVLCGVLLSR